MLNISSIIDDRWIDSISISPDGKQIAVQADSSEPIEIWDINENLNVTFCRCFREATFIPSRSYNDTDCIYTELLHNHVDDNIVSLTCLNNNTIIKVWNNEDGIIKRSFILPFHAYPKLFTKIQHNQIFLNCDEEGFMFVNIETGKQSRFIVYDMLLDINADGSQSLDLSDKILIVHNEKYGIVQHALFNKGCISYKIEGEHILSCTPYGLIKMWNIKSGKLDKSYNIDNIDLALLLKNRNGWTNNPKIIRSKCGRYIGLLEKNGDIKIKYREADVVEREKILNKERYESDKGLYELIKTENKATHDFLVSVFSNENSFTYPEFLNDFCKSYYYYPDFIEKDIDIGCIGGFIHELTDIDVQDADLTHLKPYDVLLEKDYKILKKHRANVDFCMMK